MVIKVKEFKAVDFDSNSVNRPNIVLAANSDKQWSYTVQIWMPDYFRTISGSLEGTLKNGNIAKGELIKIKIDTYNDLIEQFESYIKRKSVERPLYLYKVPSFSLFAAHEVTSELGDIIYLEAGTMHSVENHPQLLSLNIGCYFSKGLGYCMATMQRGRPPRNFYLNMLVALGIYLGIYQSAFSFFLSRI